MFCSRDFAWMQLQYTHRGTHYERTLRKRHGISVNVKKLIVALVTAADAVSAALACFRQWQWCWLRQD
jgi:hypothetical protein